MNTNDNSTRTNYRPRLSFYHPNAKGTGCALQLELHPAHDNTDGFIMLSAANQLTIGDRSALNPTFPRFDWEHKLTVKLDFNDLSKMMLVFRGETESLEEGRGIIHNATAGMTKIILRHLVDSMAEYAFELYRNTHNEESHIHFLFKHHEASGLCDAIASSFSLIAFGIPMIIAHDTDAYHGKFAEVKNVNAK